MPRLGDRARADRRAVPVLGLHRRPLRPLPPAADPARPGAAQLPQPARLLALGRRSSSCSSRVAGVWPEGAARPLDPQARAAQRPGPRSASLVLAGARGGRLARHPRAPASAPRGHRREEELAGYTAVLLALGRASRSWSSPRIRSRSSSSCPRSMPGSGSRRCGAAGLASRAAVLRRRLRGPLALLLGSFAWRFGLGFDAPWYLLELVAVGYVDVAGDPHVPRLGRGRGPARGTVRPPLRALPERGRATPTRTAPRDRPPHRARCPEPTRAAVGGDRRSRGLTPAPAAPR